jgi:DNA-binding response OmpR family regulator
MPSYCDSLVRLLEECARRLDESEAAMADARRSLDEARELARSSGLDGGSPGQLRRVFNEQRGELIASVLAALNSDTTSSTESLTRLAYDPVEHEFRLGRRKLDLTDSETVVLKFLWAKAPAPVSREQLLAHLYHDGERPADRIVDVFLSNLRRKLSLVSGGRTFIQSHRGRGWTLVLQECDTSTEAEEVPHARSQRG